LSTGKIGLALSGGAARGLAHIGVLEVLEKENIPVDMIAGTSAGAAIGALYAQGKDINQIKNLVLDLDWKRLVSLVDLALPKTGFIGGRKIKNQLKSIIGDIEFGKLRIPLACVATDIRTGEEVIIKQGSVLEGVRASISIPVILTTARWGDRYLVDGGLVNPVPVSVVKEMGADFIIAVNVIPDLSQRFHHANNKEVKKPNIFSVIMQTLYITTSQAIKSSLKGADIVIKPQLAGIGYGDFHRAQDCIQQGQLAAQSSIGEIKRQLNFYNP
jgi:NTE family protein